MNITLFYFYMHLTKSSTQELIKVEIKAFLYLHSLYIVLFRTLILIKVAHYTLIHFPKSAENHVVMIDII